MRFGGNYNTELVVVLEMFDLLFKSPSGLLFKKSAFNLFQQTLLNNVWYWEYATLLSSLLFVNNNNNFVNTPSSSRLPYLAHVNFTPKAFYHFRHTVSCPRVWNAASDSYVPKATETCFSDNITVAWACAVIETIQRLSRSEPTCLFFRNWILLHSICLNADA